MLIRLPRMMTAIPAAMALISLVPAVQPVLRATARGAAGGSVIETITRGYAMAGSSSATMRR